MLVLTRKTGDEIWLDGGRIRIKLCEIRGDRVRIGIEAPEDVDINREELVNPSHPRYVPVEERR